MAHRVTLIPGDGPGADVAPHIKRIVEAAGVDVEWDEQIAGAAAVEAGEPAVPGRVIESIRRNKIALKGLLFAPEGPTSMSPNQTFRRELGLFASVRPVRNVPGLPSRFHDLDLLMIRELTEDVYSGIEHEVVPGVVQSLRVITERASTRVARFAFEYARLRGRKRVTLVHKANILKRSDGLFMESGRRVAAEYPDIGFETIIADNAAMQLVLRPHRFDVLLLPNLFGDILSDLGAGLVGGIAAAYGVCRGEDPALRVYEVLHGVGASDGRRRDVGDPLVFLTPTLSMLRHLGEGDAAARIGDAVRQVFVAGTVTPDLGGRASCTAMSNAILARL
ncbi:MAG: isocitrate dehydrogenase [Myxococcales bacterium]